MGIENIIIRGTFSHFRIQCHYDIMHMLNIISESVTVSADITDKVIFHLLVKRILQ